MATKRTVAKKTTSKKPAKKGSASASDVPATRAPETKFDPDRNTQAILSGDASNGKPKIHAKVVSIHLSVGTYDRDRNIEDFIKEAREKLGAVPYGEDGIHATVTGSYYILDGKVCRPEDYDEKKQNFKPGAVPPQWAGGPKPNPSTASASQEQMARDAKELSSDEFDKKYKIGKYRQLGNGGTVITDEMKKAHLKKVREEREKAAEEDLEEFDWDESDVHDDEKLGAAADESAKEFTKKLKAKKKVVKKSAPKKTIKTVKKPESASAKKPAKKVVKRGKK